MIWSTACSSVLTGAVHMYGQYYRHHSRAAAWSHGDDRCVWLCSRGEDCYCRGERCLSKSLSLCSILHHMIILGSSAVIGNQTVWQTTYSIVWIVHSNCVSVLHCWRDTVTCWSTVVDFIPDLYLMLLLRMTVGSSESGSFVRKIEWGNYNPSGLPSRGILNLYWTKWALAFVCFSFFFYPFFSGYVC